MLAAGNAPPLPPAAAAWSVAADAMLLLHGLFILFAIFGGLLVLRWRRLAVLHLPAALWAAWIEIVGGICPLTTLENRLRLLGGERPYPGGCIDHYVMPVIYPPGITPTVQVLLGVGLATVNAGIYVWVLRRARR